MSKNELSLSVEFTPEYFSQSNCEITPILFTDEGMKKLLADMKKWATSFVGDATTEKGRDEMRREAKKFSTSKILLENYAKNLEASAKKIASNRVEMSKRMDECRDIVKGPADEFDRKEKERVALREDRISQINAFFNIAINGVEDVKKYMHDLRTLQEFDWMEFALKAQEIADRSNRYLADKLCEWVRREEDAKELEELKKFKADKEREENTRLQKESDEKAAAETAENAKIAAEKLAAKAIADAELKVKQAQEATRIAEEKKQADIELAVKKEQARVEAEKKAEEAETAKREANKKHRAKIQKEAVQDILDQPVRCISEEQATIIVGLISEGLISHVSIKY